MFRTYGLVSDVLSLLMVLRPVAEWGTTDTVTNVRPTNSARDELIAESKRVVSACLNLLYDLIRKNIDSQQYVADHLLIILAHISADPMAAKVAQELLSTNRELQVHL